MRVLALFKQVLSQLLYLDHLLTLPTRRQHGALLPVVNIDWFCIEWRIVSTAESAHILIGFFLFIRFLFFLLLTLLLLLLASFLRTFNFGTFGINIRGNVDFGFLIGLVLLALRLGTCILECLFYSLNLSRSKLYETVPYLTTKDFIQLNKALDCLSSNILQIVLNSLNRELETRVVHRLLNHQILILENPAECMILATDLFVIVHGLFRWCSLTVLARWLSQMSNADSSAEAGMQTHANDSVLRALPNLLQVITKFLN